MKSEIQNTKEKQMKLSDQALGTIMMALQKSILTQTDITKILRKLDFSLDSREQLVVENPPTFEVSNNLITDLKTNFPTGSD